MNAYHLLCLAWGRTRLEQAETWTAFLRVPSDTLSWEQFLGKLWRDQSVWDALHKELGMQKPTPPHASTNESEPPCPAAPHQLRPESTPSRRNRPRGMRFCGYFDGEGGILWRTGEGHVQKNKHSRVDSGTLSLCALCGISTRYGRQVRSMRLSSCVLQLLLHRTSRIRDAILCLVTGWSYHLQM